MSLVSGHCKVKGRMPYSSNTNSITVPTNFFSCVVIVGASCYGAFFQQLQAILFTMKENTKGIGLAIKADSQLNYVEDGIV